MSVVTVNTRWTSEEYVAANLYHRRTLVRPFLRQTVLVLAVLLAAVTVWSFVWVGPSWPAGLLLALALYFLVLRRFDQRWSLRRKFKKVIGEDKGGQWTFSATGIAIQAPEGSSDATWSTIHKWVETPTGFLVYPQVDIFFWIPFSSFDTPEDVSTLRQMALENVGNNERIA